MFFFIKNIFLSVREGKNMLASFSFCLQQVNNRYTKPTEVM